MTEFIDLLDLPLSRLRRKNCRRLGQAIYLVDISSSRLYCLHFQVQGHPQIVHYFAHLTITFFLPQRAIN